MTAARCSATLALLLACGPNVAADGGADSSTDDTTGGPSTTTASTAPTTTASSTSAATTTSADESSTDPTTDDGNDDAYEEDSGGTGCAFTCPPPPTTGGGGGGGGQFECDLAAQDCPEGEKCMPWANEGGEVWNASRCSPLDPDPDAPGEPCTVEGSGVSGIDSCGISSMCFDVDPKTNTGVCRSFCVAPLEPCADGNTCVAYVASIVELCVDGCDPLAPDCPDPGSCVPEQQGFVCVPGMGAAPGESCLDMHDCSSGSMCISGDLLPSCATLACCSEACDLAGPDNCMGSTACTAWDADAPPPWDQVGVCVIP